MSLMLLACLQELSGTCESHLDCGQDEVCAKGACMGRPCETDDDCDAGWECATVLHSSTCLVSCAGDRDCLGETTCQDVPEESHPQSETVDYCL